jgi:hypothetical protein
VELRSDVIELFGSRILFSFQYDYKDTEFTASLCSVLTVVGIQSK